MRQKAIDVKFILTWIIPLLLHSTHTRSSFRKSRVSYFLRPLFIYSLRFPPLVGSAWFDFCSERSWFLMLHKRAFLAARSDFSLTDRFFLTDSWKVTFRSLNQRSIEMARCWEKKWIAYVSLVRGTFLSIKLVKLFMETWWVVQITFTTKRPRENPGKTFLRWDAFANR